MFYTNVQPFGDNIAIRGVNDQGKTFQTKIPYKPTLYVHSQNPSKWRTLEGKKVSPVKWGSMKESYQAIKNYAGDVFGIDQFQYAFIADQYPGMISYDVSKMKTAYIDIEVASEHGFPDAQSANEEVLAISIKVNNDFKVYACGDYNPTPNVRYIKCTDEKALLTEFINDWSKNYPDIITGWNIRFFDIPYLVNRIVKLFGEKTAKRLSPWGWYKESNITGIGGRRPRAPFA